MSIHSFRNRPRGVSLIDVMVSVAVLATGMLAMAALQGSLVRAGAESRTRSQAIAIAEGVLGALRSRVDADIDVYDELETGTWADVVDDVAISAPTVGDYQEDFTVAATVDRFVLRETSAECGAGNVPCFRPAVVADVLDPVNPEYKQVNVTVSWTDAGGTVHDISLVDVLSSLPSANSELLVDRDLSGTPKNAAGPAVNIPIPDEVGIIPIGIGDGRETAATNPKPVVDTRSGVPTTRFDVLTYRNDSTSAQVQRKIENNVLACRCAFGPPTVDDADATFFTDPVRPTFWNGNRYATPTFAEDDGVTHPASWGAPDQAQSSLCDDCCRDHFDPAGATNRVSPLRTSHTHFGFGDDGNVDLDTAVTSGEYAEACRMIRVDGIWRVAADFRLEQMGLLKTTTANSRQAGDPAPDSTATGSYENFAKQLINARANPPTAESGLSASDIEALVDSNGLNNPERILLTQLEDDIRFLHNRALYFDYLEESARVFIAAQIADCTEAEAVLCVLPFVPVTSLNATELAAWGRSDDENLLVEGQAGLVESFDERRGTFEVDKAGGRASPTPGGAGEHPDGTESSALVGMSRANRGLLALSFPGAGVNPDDAAETLADSQLFEYDSTATSDKDSDGVPDSIDNCPLDQNPDQTNTDSLLPSGGDVDGDACDANDDDDTLDDANDSCPVDVDSGVDDDKDGIDDVCDPSQDMDRDTVLDGFDNCPMTANTDQKDANTNGIGDECERDTDGDGVFDHKDNCIDVANADQADADNDGEGDACEPPVTATASFQMTVAIENENLGVLSPKPRVFWAVSSTLHTCQTTVSAGDSDPNPYVCDNAVVPSPLLVIDQYNRVVTAGANSANVSNPCRGRNSAIAQGPAKVFPATCYNYELRSLTQNGTTVDISAAQVQNPGLAGPTDTESTSLSLSNLADGDSFSATFGLTSSTSLLGLGESTGYTCNSATNEPTFIFTACPQ